MGFTVGLGSGVDVFEGRDTTAIEACGPAKYGRFSFEIGVGVAEGALRL